MSHLLLPPNSTALERAIADITHTATLGDMNLPITGIKLDNPPDGWLDYLIYEWGLTEFLPFFNDKRALIRSTLHFNRIRGTAASIHIALSWRGLSARIIEYEPSELMADLERSDYKPYLHFGEFDIVIDDNFSKTEITAAIELANLAKPVRSRLTRLVGSYDRRKFVLDESHLSCALLSDDSGVRITSDDLAYDIAKHTDGNALPKLSLMQRISTSVEYPTPDVQAIATIHQRHIIYSWRADMPYLDDLPDPIEVLMASSGSGTLAPITYAGQVWADHPWQDTRWDRVRELIMSAQ